MITFYPGPSKVYPQVEWYLVDAYQCGILSANHRSDVFMKMLEQTISRLKDKLNVPSDYEVYFVSSATECWEIISQSLVGKSSFHIYNGAFGAKWMEYAQKLRPGSHGVSFEMDQIPTADLLHRLQEGDDMICLTHNETSNGTSLPDSFLQDLREKTDKLIAVDATSSMAGVRLPWSNADVWYASVQKCFGLPSGLGIMIVSPNAVAHALSLGEKSHYNSLLFTRDNFLKFQTPYTPNTLAIYLLGRVMEVVDQIDVVALNIKQRAKDLYQFLSDQGYSPLVTTPEVRSETVIAVKLEGPSLANIKVNAKLQNITLGNGYGAWKEHSFRIANFPAINLREIQLLKSFLSKATFE